MTTILGCSGAGWTLAVKISGNEATFLYSSEYWTNKQPFNLQGGLSGLDEVETKLPSYWSTSFTTLCVGMKVNGVTNWLMINHAAPSLYSLLAKGQYTQLNLGRSAWKSLIDDSSLQVNCGMEGFNVSPQSYYSDPAVARIGIITNGENDCFSCDSRIGFGTGGSLAGQDGTNSCGNEVEHSPDNGVRHTKAHCYIFVK